jgi:guanine deaminase
MRKREDFMRRAIALAEENVERGLGGPFGAVVVRAGRIIGEGVNRVTSDLDPTAHAEVNAIRAACISIGAFSLAGSELFTSCEPCPMCLSAIYWARLDGLYFANTRIDAARIGFDDDHIYREIARPLDQRALPATLLLAEEGAAAFAAWLAKPDRTPY